MPHKIPGIYKVKIHQRDGIIVIRKYNPFSHIKVFDLKVMAGKLPQPFKIKGTLFSVLNTEGSVIKIAKKIQGPDVGIEIFFF